METCLKNTANAGAAPATVNKSELSDATVLKGWEGDRSKARDITIIIDGCRVSATCEPGDRPAAQERAAVGS